eukprot:gene11925-biopygen370
MPNSREERYFAGAGQPLLKRCWIVHGPPRTVTGERRRNLPLLDYLAWSVSSSRWVPPTLCARLPALSQVTLKFLPSLPSSPVRRRAGRWAQGRGHDRPPEGGGAGPGAHPPKNSSQQGHPLDSLPVC